MDQDQDQDKDKEIIQVDYTPIDILIADSKPRTKSTKPSITILTDVYTRKIIEFHVAHSEENYLDT